MNVFCDTINFKLQILKFKFPFKISNFVQLFNFISLYFACPQQYYPARQEEVSMAILTRNIFKFKI